jgi:hypothetical protein
VQVRTVEDAARVLRHAEHLATLLSNQAATTRNSVLVRLVLLQHVFLSVLPLPLPLSHPHRGTRCFWAARPVRYETQVRERDRERQRERQRDRESE